MIKRREEMVRMSAHTPGTSSQALKKNRYRNENHKFLVGKIGFTSLVVRKLHSFMQ